MLTWRILIITLVFLIAVCMAQDIQLSARPIRPDVFENAKDVKDYVAKMKAFYAKTGTRYGKRFSPVLHKQQRQHVSQPDWQSLYDMIENYKEQ